jgi:hypothetical protein
MARSIFESYWSLSLQTLETLLGLAAALTLTTAPVQANAALRQHPSLLVDEQEFELARQAVRTDPVLAAWKVTLEHDAEGMLTAPLLRPVTGDEENLDVARDADTRIYTLAGLYQLDHDPRYAARARLELMNLAAWPEWRPRHFLQTAEMTAAISVGMDWLSDVLTPEDRMALETAIATKGLEEGEHEYHRLWGHWRDSTENWNQVCNCGLILGALALRDTHPQLAQEVLADAHASLKAIAQPLDDGGWGEGPGYWAYATTYTCYALEALEHAGITDADTWFRPSEADTGAYRTQVVGPTGTTFNYADANAKATRGFGMFFLARHFNRPEFVWSERRSSDPPTIFHILWGAEAPQAAVEPPLAQAFPVTGLAFLRGAWNAKAAWVGFKGGSNAGSHSHLDLGTFVYEALGVRWAIDLGPDDYNLPGYFSAQRWQYYRITTAGHNTLTLDGRNQSRQANAPLVGFSASPKRADAAFNLTNAYEGGLSRALRTVSLVDGTALYVRDDLILARPGAVGWHFHTRADVKVAGDHALLQQAGRTLEARILEPHGASFEARAVSIPPPQLPADGVTDLQINLARLKGPLRLVVEFLPVNH